MHADIKGALAYLKRKHVPFEYNGRALTKLESRKILEYGLSKGYTTTKELKNEEIEDILDKISYGGQDEGVLRRFIREFFPYGDFKKLGFFTPEMKGDYYAQATRICKYFKYKTVFEYGAVELDVHLTFAGERPNNEPFSTHIPNIYD